MEIINNNFFNVESSVLLLCTFFRLENFGENKNEIRNKNWTNLN